MAETATDDGSYRGVVGALPYALRASDSWLFRSYAVVGALLSLLVGALLLMGLVVLVDATLGSSASVTLSRAFYAVVGLLVVAPMLAPVLLVARRHRRRTAVAPGYDRRLALAGYGYVLSLYVGLVVSTPSGSRSSVDGALAPAVEALYALPQAAGVVPPLLAAAAIALVHRRSR